MAGCTQAERRAMRERAAEPETEASDAEGVADLVRRAVGRR